MTPAALLREIRDSGVSVALGADGHLKVSGDQPALTRWLPAIRDHKPELLSLLAANDAAIGVPLTSEDQAWANRYLDDIEEHDPTIRAEWLANLQTNPVFVQQMRDQCVSRGLARWEGAPR